MKIEGCEFPDRLLYDFEGGVWAERGTGTIRVGITNILSWSYGTFSKVTFKEIGTVLRKDRVLGTMEAAKHFDVFRSPVSGTLSSVNERLLNEPALLNRDPYGEGWFAEIKPEGHQELDLLLRLPEAEQEIAQSIHDRHVRCFAAFPDIEMVDIGVECSAVLAKLDDLMGRSSPGTVVHVVSDDNTAEIEMQRWSDQTGNRVVDFRKEGTLYHFIVEKR